MKEISNSSVMYKDITYISKKDNKEKSYTQFYIKLMTKDGSSFVCKVDLDYNAVKVIRTHLQYNGLETLEV